MHKKFVNHCTIDLTIIPDGPILIKSGKEGADPTKPDMEFVETYHAGGRTIYLPGSSLKGAIRAHAERIVRTIEKGQKDGISVQQAGKEYTFKTQVTFTNLLAEELEFNRSTVGNCS